MVTQSHYDVLGVPKTATFKEIQAAYREIALTCHPDRVGDNPEVIVRFRAATEAYRVLSDPERRAVYDRGIMAIRSVRDLLLHHPSGRRVMETMLPSAPAAPQRGTDACVIVSVRERNRARGKTLRISAPLGASVTDIPLQVPQGGEAFSTCTLPRLGYPGRNGADPGDLLVVFVD